MIHQRGQLKTSACKPALINFKVNILLLGLYNLYFRKKTIFILQETLYKKSRFQLLIRMGKINPLFIIAALIFLGNYSYSQKSDNYELISISFIGNSAFSSSTLADKIRSKETPWWVYKFINSFSELGAPPVYFNFMFV